MNALLRRSALAALLLALTTLIAPTANASAADGSVPNATAPELATTPLELDDDLEAIRARFEAELQRIRDEFRRELERVQASDSRADVRAMQTRLEELEKENAELRRALREMRGGAGTASGRRLPQPASGDRPRGQLGVTLSPTEPELAELLKIKADDSFQVTGVQENSAASRMRLRAGDVIIGFDGKTGGLEKFIEHMSSKRAGDELVLTYARRQNSGETLRITGRTELTPWRDPNANAEAPAGGSVPAARLVPMPPPPVEPPTPARRGVSLGVSVVESDNGNGVVISDVTEGGNAATARLAIDDRIVSFGDRKISNIDDLRGALGQARPGQEVTIAFFRAEVKWQSRLRLAGADGGAALLSGPDRADGGAKPSDRKRGFLGVLLDEQGNGIVITEVVEGSAAASMGLRAADRIVSLNGTRVRTIPELGEVLGRLFAGSEVRIVYRRDGNREVAEGTLGAREDDGQSSAPVPAPEGVAVASPGQILLGGVAPASGSASAGAPVSSGSSGSASGSSGAASKTPAAERRGSLGVVAEIVSNAVVIAELPARSAAAAAGARVGDTISRIQGIPVTGFDTIVDTLAKHRVGDRIALTVERDGRPIDLRVTLAPAIDSTTSAPAASAATSVVAAATVPVATVPTMTVPATTVPAAAKALRPYLGIEVEERADGIWVIAIEPDAPARSSGLRVGDRVLSVAGSDVTDLESMRRAVDALSLENASPFTVLRAGGTASLEVTPEPR